MSAPAQQRVGPVLRPTLPDYPGYTSYAEGVASSYRPTLIAPEGSGENGIWIIGEASGEQENVDGLPFRPYAPAGSVLERALRETGIKREECVISNMVWYRPPRNWLEGAPYEWAAVHACRHLNDMVQQHNKPKVIVALGGVAFRYLTGIKAPKWTPKRQGKSWTLSAMRGWVAHPSDPILDSHYGDGRVRSWDPWYDIPVLPSYHPSFLRRGSKEADEDTGAKTKSAGGGTGGGMGLLSVLKHDLKTALRIAQGGAKKKNWLVYKDCTSREMRRVIDRCKADPSLLISYDWETHESADGDEDEIENFGAPTQFQVALDTKEAFVWLWDPELLPLIRELMALPNPKLDWNGRGFDRELMRGMAIRVDSGVWHDGMDLWSCWQPDLPRGLQYAASFSNELDSAWKHSFPIDPQGYGGLDVLWPQAIWENVWQKWMPQVKSRHTGVTLAQCYQEQVVELAPVLDEMQEIGIPVDEEERQKVKAQLAEMAKDEFLKIQEMAPDEIKKIEPKNGYANPKIAQKMMNKGELELGEKWITREFLIEVKEKKKKGQTEEQLYLDLADKGLVEPRHQFEIRHCRLQPFLVTSPQQLKDYINYKKQEEIAAAAQGRISVRSSKPKYEVPIDWKTKKETTSKKELLKLFERTGDPLFKSAILYREIKKMDGTYVGDRDEDEETGEITNITGWAPQRDGRVHPHFGFGTGIGQLTAKDPNSMNMTRHNKMFGHLLRGMIKAPDGYEWVSADMKSFHVLTLGFEAGDPNYMRLSRLDMHSFFTATGLLNLYKPEHLLDLPDEELLAKLKWHRKNTTQTYDGKTFGEIRDTRAKRGILGYGNGLSAMGMWRNNPDDFNSKADAQKVIDALDGLFPKPCAYRKAQAQEADREGQLVSRYGFRRVFNAVFEKRQLKWNEAPPRNAQTMVDGKGRTYVISHGNDYEAAISFRHMNDAFGMIRDCMVKFYKEGLSRMYGMCNNEHDALKFCSPKKLRDQVIADIKRIMQAPSPKLRSAEVPEGLWCEVEISVGESWKEMKEFKG